MITLSLLGIHIDWYIILFTGISLLGHVAVELLVSVYICHPVVFEGGGLRMAGVSEQRPG